MARRPGRFPNHPKPITRIGVQLDIDESPSVELTKDGPRTTRTHRVRNLPGDGPSRLWYAMYAPLIPRYGDIHPTIPFLPCSRIHAVLEPGSNEIGLVTTDYFYPVGGNQHFINPLDPTDRLVSQPQLEITSTLRPTKTQLAFWFHPPQTEESWQPLWLKYRDKPADRGEEGPPGPWQFQGGEIDYQIPMMTFRYMRREPSDAFIGDKAREFVGTINEFEIFGQPNQPGTGDPKHFWLCTRIDAVSDDGGKTYNASYEFQYNPDSWNPVIVFANPVDGKPVSHPVWGESIRQVRVFREKDFFRLGLVI